MPPEYDFDIIYTYHSPVPHQIEYYKSIREKAKEMALLLDDLCPNSREKANAFNRLEEVVMWANASIARKE